MPLFFLLLLALLLHVLQYPQDLVGPVFGQVCQALAELEDEAAVGDDLFGAFVVGIERAFPADVGAAVVEARVVDGRVAIGLVVFPLKLHDVVFEVDGVDVDVGAVQLGAEVDAAVELQVSHFALGAGFDHVAECIIIGLEQADSCDKRCL